MTQSVVAAATVGSGLKYTQRNLSMVQRILESTRVDGDCLLWTRGTNASAAYKAAGRPGYGVCCYEGHGRRALTHRLMYMSLHGVILNRGQFVCHSCDNKLCVNPRHLWLGDASSNMKDYVAKGMYVPRHVVDRKTTTAQRAAIAQRYRRFSGNTSNARALACEYGISHSRVRQIVAASKRVPA